MSDTLYLLETPRDAFQGLRKTIPTTEKVALIQSLIDAGFKHIEVGSFVSPKAVPQMADSADVIRQLPQNDALELLALIVNDKSIEAAKALPNLKTLAFPFSCNDTFQRRNTKRSIDQTWPLIETLAEATRTAGRQFLVYLSMVFGNPYGEPNEPAALIEIIRRLKAMGIGTIHLADTIGCATPQQIEKIFELVQKTFPNMTFGAHFHATPNAWQNNIEAAWQAGCRRYDGAVTGLGGCPFAEDELVGNLPSEQLVAWLTQKDIATGIDATALQSCIQQATLIRNRYA